MRWLASNEEQILLGAADVRRSAYMRTLIVLAIETGMRKGDFLTLDWGHIDLQRRVAHLPLTKIGDSRDVPLSTRAVEILRAFMTAGSGQVFNVAPNAARPAWERLVCRAGWVDLHFHDLRHEAVSRLFEKGLNVVEASTISGHKELRMLQRYGHLRTTDLVARLG
ncbi:site-specific integrase [Microvirga arabica]|uniref:Site-specific integrase n=1 Tax=Microvirga arabica TaxID=1128671 RepID=A0ABV6YDY4_9HYPH